MRMPNRGKRDYLKYIIITVAIVAIIALGIFLLVRWEKGQEIFSGDTPIDKRVEYQGKEYELKSGLETFLVLGLDKFDDEDTDDSYNNNKQADFLMLFVFDNEEQKCSVLHINRDTMASVNVLGVAGNKIDTVTKQIALAHTYGNGGAVSSRNVADSVSAMLGGMRIDHYVSLTMDAVPIYNDLLGGVEVTVLDDFTGIDETLVKGESVKLVGTQALTYIRTRYGLEDSTNSTRMKRQQQYLTALKEKTLKQIAEDNEFIVTSTVKLSEYMSSDRSVTQLQTLMEKFASYEFVKMDDITGEFKLGKKFMEFYPNADSVEATVIKLFYKEKD